MAVSFGLLVVAALEAVMTNGAEILGLGDDIEALEPGKLGNVIAIDGNPVQIQTEVTKLFTLGPAVATDNKHKSL
jgi:imidazolonepropionase-like amidohydrolase